MKEYLPKGTEERIVLEHVSQEPEEDPHSIEAMKTSEGPKEEEALSQDEDG